MDSKQQTTQLSKFLSFVLRHEPGSIGLHLDGAGWADVDDLISRCRARGKPLDRSTLEHVVATSEKKRFAFNEDGTRIRASQGHSVEVDLGYAPAVPPAVLFHGTVASSVDAIRTSGLQKMARHHVHLSVDVATAKNVGGRRGAPLILEIQALKMHEAGMPFFLSANGVWLTDSVPPAYIVFP